MLVTLLRTGGIIPMTKQAEKHVSWTEEEIRDLLNAIATKGDGPGETRDATGYQLKVNDETFSVDLNKIPSRFASTFDELKDNLKIVKNR